MKCLNSFFIFAFVSMAPCLSWAESCDGLLRPKKSAHLDLSATLRQYISPEQLVFREYLMAAGYEHPVVEPITQYVEDYSFGAGNWNLGGNVFYHTYNLPFKATLGSQQIDVNIYPYHIEPAQTEIEELKRQEFELMAKIRPQLEKEMFGLFWAIDEVKKEDLVQPRLIEYRDDEAKIGVTWQGRGPSTSEGWQFRSPRAWWYYQRAFVDNNQPEVFVLDQKYIDELISIESLRKHRGSEEEKGEAVARDVNWHDEIRKDPLLLESIDPAAPIQTMPSDLAAICKVAEEDSQSIIVKIDINIHRREISERSRDLLKMFYLLDWQLVQRSYRNSGLVPNNLASSLGLANSNARRGERTIYLYYNKRVWNSFLYRLHRLGDHYADAFYPLLPEFGLSLMPEERADVLSYDHTENRSMQEIGRLFNNDSPDPLSILKNYKRDRLANYKFIYRALQDIPAENLVMAEALTREHLRMYRDRFGLIPYDVHFDQTWGRMVELREKSPVVLERFRKLLNLPGP